METLYTLIKNNVVENIIVADAEFAATIAPGWQAVVLLNKPDGAMITASIGWGWDGTNFVAPIEPIAPQLNQ